MPAASAAPASASDSLVHVWDDPLPAEERDALLDKAARFVVNRGMEAPTVWALEMHKPFAFLASQAIIVGAPSLAPLLGIERMQTLSRLLASPGAVEDLICRIETLSAERRDATPAAPAADSAPAAGKAA